jgi:ribosome-binding protein aMBF1 (putative translation factor)
MAAAGAAVTGRRKAWVRRVARRIRAERERAGLSQEALAARVGAHRQTVYRWEAGALEPSAWHLRLLARCLPGLQGALEL